MIHIKNDVKTTLQGSNRLEGQQIHWNYVGLILQAATVTCINARLSIKGTETIPECLEKRTKCAISQNVY